MPLIKVVAGVLLRDAEVFICQRRFDDTHPGKWEFPGGKVEPGETTAACIRRELREELGIEAQPAEELWRTQHRYPDGRAFDLVFVRIAAFDGVPQNRCFADLRWVPIRELAGYDFLDADRKFIRLLASGALPSRHP